MEIIVPVMTTEPKNFGKGKYKKNVLANVDFIKQQIVINGGAIGIKASDIRTMLDAPDDYTIMLMYNRLYTYLKPLGIKTITEIISGEKVFVFQFKDPKLEEKVE